MCLPALFVCMWMTGAASRGGSCPADEMSCAARWQSCQRRVRGMQHCPCPTAPGTVHIPACEIAKVFQETERTERPFPAPRGCFCPGTAAGKPILDDVREAGSWIHQGRAGKKVFQGILGLMDQFLMALTWPSSVEIRTIYFCNTRP